MMWAEYVTADLTEEQKESRPYKQGRQSLDGSKTIVRFVNNEQAWPSPLRSTDDVEVARSRVTGVEYTAPLPVAEQVKQALLLQAQAARQKEESGIVWTDNQDNSFMFPSKIEDQVRYAAAQLAITKGRRSDTTPWSCAQIVDGTPVPAFRPTTNAELSDILDAAYDHAAKCIVALANVEEKLRAGDLSATFEAEFAAL